ncbi:MAG: hypothetical protein Q9221_000043 [Calogaya cf. arnoldii]
MTKRIERFGLKKAIPSHGRAGASKLNGRTTLETVGAATPRTNLAVQQQDAARTTNEDHRLVFEVYADGEGCLKLATTSVIRNGEKVIIDAVAPLVQKHNSKYLGESPAPVLSHGADSVSGSRSKTKLARRKDFNNRKQSNGSNASTSFSEYCSPVSTRPSALSADLDGVSTPGERINTPDADSEDGHHESDDDDGEHLLETESEQFDILTPGDVAALEVYYTKGVCQVGQLTMKKVLKQWVKVKQPKKQSANPYNGRKNRPQQEREKKESGKADPNPGISTAPDWWPTQDGWPTKGCRHKEPDHLKKPERTILALRLLSLTGTEGCEDFTVDKLIESTESIEMSPNQRRMLEQLYEVRKKQQAFQHDEIDAETKIPVFRPKGQPSQKKRRVTTNRKKGVRRVKQERRETSEKVVEQSTQGTPASMSESAQSFGSSGTPLATAKIEPPQHSTDSYENYVEANYLPMFDTPRFEPTMTAPSVYRPVFASPTPTQNHILQEIPPFAHAMARAPSERGRMAFRNDNRFRRRPTSVCKQNSPSYQNGAVPREVGWFQTDDMYCGVRPPLVSYGYPHTGLPIGLDDPMSHSHGVLPPEQQQQECMKHNCTNYTPVERHELGALRHGWQLPLQHQQGGMPQFHNQPLSFNNQQGFPQSQSPQLHFNNFQGGMSQSHGLDVAIEQLMSEEDLTPNGSLNRSLGQA